MCHCPIFSSSIFKNVFYLLFLSVSVYFSYQYVSFTWIYIVKGLWVPSALKNKTIIVVVVVVVVSSALADHGL